MILVSKNITALDVLVELLDADSFQIPEDLIDELLFVSALQSQLIVYPFENWLYLVLLDESSLHRGIELGVDLELLEILPQLHGLILHH